MNITYAMQRINGSIFLAGPTPRSDDVESWRPSALWHLDDLGFKGEVYVPESEGWKQRDNYDGQVFWEWKALKKADAVAFWVPRELETMPAFTTNVEFGYLVASGKVVYGRPPGAPKTSYLDLLAKKHDLPIYEDLRDLMLAAMYMSDRE